MTKAMIFAAGMGTRLRPLTNDRPKPLVEVAGKPMIAYVLQRLMATGVRDVVVNVHYLGDMLEDWLLDFALTHDLKLQISNERAQLLDTGGGLKKATPMLLGNGPIVVCNADILTNLDFSKMLAAHREGDWATLAVQDRPSSRKLLFDSEGLLCGWRNKATQEERMTRQPIGELLKLSFSGTQIVDNQVLENSLPEKVFSMIDWYLALAAQHPIRAWRHDTDDWMDLGKPEMLPEAELMVHRWK